MITYFYALFPAAAQAVETYATAVRVQADHSLRGTLVGLRRLHLTVHFVDRRAARDAALERELVVIGDQAVLEPVDLELNAATSFAHGLVSPCVFLPSSTPAALERIAGDVAGAAGRLPGAPRPAHPFRPHATFLRSRDRLPGSVAIDSLLWQPAALALAMGVSGEPTYTILRSWPIPRP